MRDSSIQVSSECVNPSFLSGHMLVMSEMSSKFNFLLLLFSSTSESFFLDSFLKHIIGIKKSKCVHRSNITCYNV